MSDKKTTKTTKYVDKMVKQYGDFFRYLVEQKKISMKTSRSYVSCMEDEPSRKKAIVLNHYDNYNQWMLAKAISEKKKAEKTEKVDEDRVIKLHTPAPEDSEDSEDVDEIFMYDDPHTQKLAEDIHCILSLGIDFQKKVEILNIVVMGYIK